MRGTGERAMGAAVLVLAAAAALAGAQGARLPYATVEHPRFEAAAQAKFLGARDLVIGVSEDGVAKAYAAAILAQHGVVADRMPDGPIAATW